MSGATADAPAAADVEKAGVSGGGDAGASGGGGAVGAIVGRGRRMLCRTSFGHTTSFAQHFRKQNKNRT
jgi:hypothetical protein